MNDPGTLPEGIERALRQVAHEIRTVALIEWNVAGVRREALSRWAQEATEAADAIPRLLAEGAAAQERELNNLRAWKEEALVSLAKWHALGDVLLEICPLTLGDDIAVELTRQVPERFKAMTEPGTLPEEIARKFHEAYERLAPAFGYATREASRKPWADVPAQNRDLMIAVCAEILPGILAEGAAKERDAMTFQGRAIESLQQADHLESRERESPPAVFFLLAKAAVWALLAIAVELESLPKKERLGA
jgi:hypothetical protein